MGDKLYIVGIVVVPLFLLLISIVLKAKRIYFGRSSYEFKERSRSILSALGGPRVFGDYRRREEQGPDGLLSNSARARARSI